MEEEQREQEKPLSLLDRIKNSIQKKNSGEDLEKEEFDESKVLTEPDTTVEDTGPPLGRGVMDVSTDSLLFTIWKEWKEASDEGGGGVDEIEALEEIEAMDLVLESYGAQELPLSDTEVERETERAKVELMMKAKQYKTMTAANEEGVVPNLDAYMIIHIAHTRMAAWAFVFPPSGEGKPLQKAQAYMALHESSVRSGIDEGAIEYLVKEQPYFRLVPIAYGKPMVPGTDGTVIEMFKRKMDKSFAVNERGEVDYRVQNYIQPVHVGDVICDSTPPTDGTDGYDVLGTILPAKHGQPARLLAGQNTTLNEEKTQITAAMDGRILFEGERFNVKPLFFVQGDVDLRVGNIEFLGDVHVTGDVRDDFIIHASGSVTVDGIVEGAYIDAGRDVIIAKGILGDEKAVIKAGGNVQTEFIESCIIYAGDTVQASSIISSYIYSDNMITSRVGRGTVIGGKLVAANLIDVKIIGCRAERVTTLVVGEKPYAEYKKEEIASDLSDIAKEKDEIERMNGSEDAEIDEQNQERLQKATKYRLRKAILMMQEAHLKKELEEFEDVETDFKASRIKVDIIYPITKVHIRDYTYTISKETQGCLIHHGEEEIELQ